MKRILLIYLFILIAVPFVYSQDTTASNIQVDFRVPKEWKKISDNTFVLKNIKKALNYWEKNFSGGHQPWRFDPANIAGTCLWEFGIKDDNTIIFDFASHLKVIKMGEVYSITSDKYEYVVYLRTEKTIPIAYKFEIKPVK